MRRRVQFAEARTGYLGALAGRQKQQRHKIDSSRPGVEIPVADHHHDGIVNALFDDILECYSYAFFYEQQHAESDAIRNVQFNPDE